MIWLYGQPVIEKRSPALLERLVQARVRLGRAPRLQVFLVGEDPASHIYVEMKRKRGSALGVEVLISRLPASVGAQAVYQEVQRANAASDVDGVLIQRPLPFPTELANGPSLQEWVTPLKDVDAFHPFHLGRLAQGKPLILACTPAGIMALLDHYEIPLEGQLACVVGRSPLVGQPMGLALVNRNATLIQCHSRTRDLASLTRQAALLVVAAGARGLVTHEHIRPGATVIDVGIHRKPNGALAGDVVAESAANVASRLTPVPGGVGPMTVHFLFENLLTLVEARLDTARL